MAEAGLAVLVRMDTEVRNVVRSLKVQGGDLDAPGGTRLYERLKRRDVADGVRVRVYVQLPRRARRRSHALPVALRLGGPSTQLVDQRLQAGAEQERNFERYAREAVPCKANVDGAHAAAQQKVARSRVEDLGVDSFTHSLDEGNLLLADGSRRGVEAMRESKEKIPHEDAAV